MFPQNPLSKKLGFPFHSRTSNLKDFHIMTFNHNIILRNVVGNLVGILTSELEYMSEYWQETAGTLKEVTGESLIKGLWTELGLVQGKK